MSRIKFQGRNAVYHCVSRVAGNQPVIDDIGKGKLVALFGQLAAFCGIEVITYCVLSNHFHVLVRVPVAPDPTDGDLVARLEVLHGRKGPLVEAGRSALANQGRLGSKLRALLQERMGDVSPFMKEVKQRFSRWYNPHSGRSGTLWAERFKSLLVEDQPEAVGTVAAYIDLNPVRAEIVQDPKDYPYCGYAAAVAGKRAARAGLLSIGAAKDWKNAAAEYRKRLGVGEDGGGSGNPALLNRQKIKRVLARGGTLTEAQVLRLRLRHMSDGVVLGSKEFVDEVFHLNRSKFGSRRKSGARPIRGTPLTTLTTMRDLRVDAIS